MASRPADQEMLFEALALHLGFVTQAAIDQARQALREDAPGALGLLKVLVDREALSAEQAETLEKLASNFHLQHEVILTRCLLATSASAPLRLDLARRLTELKIQQPSVPPGVVNEADRSGSDSRLADEETVPPDVVDEADRSEPASEPYHADHQTALPEDSPSRPPVGPEVVDEESDDEDQNDSENENGKEEHDSILAAPAVLGNRFQILHTHAQGGIGVVSVAFDSQLQREVALKQIKGDHADDPDSRARFLVEAEFTGRLEHPGIVPVYGLGFDDQGRPYYAMRFVRGVTLDEAIARFHKADARHEHDTPEQTLELRGLLGRFVSVCHTMAYAHSRGVLHRDLKPSNVLLGPYNETLIVDWGLAKLLPQGDEVAPLRGDGDEHDDSTRRNGARPGPIVPPLEPSSSTEPETITAFGTPAFMSPEQADGMPDRLCPVSDVYSLGAMLYTLLCGRPPFEFVWCDLTQLLGLVMRGEFASPRQVNPRVPRALEAVCLRAMATRPEDRYRSALELATEIERWLADEPVAAYREPFWSQALRIGRRKRRWVALAAALLLSAVAALLLGTIVLGKAHPQTQNQTQRQAAVSRQVAATFLSGEAENRDLSLRRRDYKSRVNLAYREFQGGSAAAAEQLLDGCLLPLRDWEWEHVLRLSHPELDTFTSVDRTGRFDVWSLVFSPDGHNLVSGSGPWPSPGSKATAALVLRERKSGRELFAHRGWPGAVQAVAFSPDGRHIVAGTGTSDAPAGAVLTCHNATTGRILWRAQEHEVNILSLAYSPDGATVASACCSIQGDNHIGYVRLLDAASGKVTGLAQGGPGGVTSVVFSPDGNRLAMASRGVVDVWDRTIRSLVFQLLGNREHVCAVAYSPDGHWIASGGWDRTIRLWDASTGRLVRSLSGSRGIVRGLSFRPDGKQLISCGEDCGLSLWDVASGQPLATFFGHRGIVHCVSFSPDGVQAASGSMDGTIKLWPAAAPKSQVIFRNGSGSVSSVSFHSSGDRVASAHDGGIRVWDPRTGEEDWSVLGPRGRTGRVALAYSPDGKLLYATGVKGVLNALDARTGSLVQQFVTTSAPIVAVVPSPDGMLLATVAEDGQVTIWRIATGRPIRTLNGYTAAVTAVAFAPDGKKLATASEDRRIKIWDVNSGAELATLSGHTTGVRGVTFAPDGRLLASCGGQYHAAPAAELFLWDASSGKLVRKLDGHTAPITALAFLPRGNRLLSASDDRTIKLWDPETGDDVFTLRGHNGGVVSLAPSRDGRQIVSGNVDSTARVWSAEPPSVSIDQVRRRSAVELVSTLFETHLLKSEVKAALQSDPALHEPLRSLALRIADRRGEDAQALYESAWPCILRPEASAELSHQALRRLETACSLVADDPDRLDEYRHVLALALYRAGRADEALRMVAHASRGPGPIGDASALSIDLAVSALASQKLGRHAEAIAARDRLRSLVNARPDDQQAAGFLREVESVVHEIGTRKIDRY